MKFNRRWLLVPLLAGTALIGAVGPGFASSMWAAGQSGFHQWGSATATNLTIRVEAGIDGTSPLLPDAPGCNPPAFPGCPGGALSFTIENTSSVPLRITGWGPLSFTCAGGGTCFYPILSDKQNDGTWLSPPVGSDTDSNSCALYLTLASPAAQIGSRPWPIVPAHSVLAVNGSDALSLGAHMVHLAYNTPDTCQGADFYVPLQIFARDSS